ncbi:MAG: hypothetical protein ABEI07_02060 [Candidatus Nanohaloarchaea archaeon]
MTLSEYLRGLEKEGVGTAGHFENIFSTFERNGWKSFYEDRSRIIEEVKDTVNRYRNEPLYTEPFVFSMEKEDSDNPAFLQIALPDTEVDRLLTVELLQEGPVPAFQGLAQAEISASGYPAYFEAGEGDSTVLTVSPDPVHFEDYGTAVLAEDLARVDSIVALNDAYTADPRNDSPDEMQRNHGYEWIVHEWYKKAPKWEEWERQRSG